MTWSNTCRALGDRTKRPEGMPSAVTAGATVARGDERDDFVNTFVRYLPAFDVTTVHIALALLEGGDMAAVGDKIEVSSKAGPRSGVVTGSV